MSGAEQRHKRRWRDYASPAGVRPVKAFIASLSDEDAAEAVAAMREIMDRGTVAARHLRGDIWEVRATGAHQAFRILFATEGRYNHVLLALEGFSKKTQRTPTRLIDLAERRLRDWRERGVAMRDGQTGQDH